MKASEIINDSMTLDEKLKAIDAAIAKQPRGMSLSDVGNMLIECDPATLTICEGCE